MTLRLTRRVEATALAALIALGAFPTMAQDVELDFWTEFTTAPKLPVLEEIVADFNAANPGIVVTHTGFESTPYETTLRASFAGGNPADIVEINGGANMFHHAEGGGLLDLTDFVAERQDQIAPGVENWYEFSGKSCGVPLGLSIGNLLWYNTRMFEEGIDPATLSTWEGFRAAAQTF